MPSLARYPEWKAPPQDSAILIWPEPANLLSQTRESFKQLSNSDCRIGDFTLSELRRRQRERMGLPADQMILATGHQAELYHAGVWAKLALIHAAAPKLDAIGIHLAVDTDSPKHLHLRWPGGSRAITDDPAISSAQWSGLLQAPSKKYLTQIQGALAESSRDWSFEPLAGEYLKNFPTSGPLTPAIVDTQRRLDQSLGMNHRVVMASPVWNSDGYLELASHLLQNPIAFAACYNDALGEYRIVHRLRSDARPMPNLLVEPDRCESPFWVDDLITGRRERAMLTRDGDGWRLGDEFLQRGGNKLRAYLQSRNLRLSPRALTLTLFMRLLVVDQFVHGIGGGRYDQVTNRVMENFFKLAPPAFSVSTATLYFPTAVGRQRVCLPCLAQEGHRLRHGLLGERKGQLVNQIARLPHRSTERQKVFFQIHRELSSALQTDARVRAWQQRVEASNEQHLEEQMLFDRELFYAIQPRERLIGLMETYQDAF